MDKEWNPEVPLEEGYVPDDFPEHPDIEKHGYVPDDPVEVPEDPPGEGDSDDAGGSGS